MFHRVAIVSGGEAAMRLILAVRELRDASGARPLAIVLRTAGDRRSRVIREADDDVRVRRTPAARRDDVEAETGIGRALVESGADAVWTGWGRVVEPLACAELCERLGLAFIGPPATVMRVVGDAGSVRQAAAEAGVPVAQHDAAGARRLDVQIAADHRGTAWALGVRDASIRQHGHSMLVESSSPVVDPEMDARIRAAAVTVAKTVGYRNLGTVTFLYEPATRSFWLQGVKARLDGGHAVTEATTGIDLVKLQLRLAAGEPLHGEVPPVHGHALLARLDAVAPPRAGGPGGRLGVLELPQGPGIRVDTGVATGDVVSDGDPTIARIVAWGRDRPESQVRLRRALRQARVVIQGGATNRPALIALVERAPFVVGAADLGWVDDVADTSGDAHAAAALLMATIDAWEDDLKRELSRFYAWAARGRPKTDLEAGHTLDLRYRGHRYRCVVWRLSPTWFRVAVAGSIVELEVTRLGRIESRLAVGGRRHRAISVTEGLVHTVEIDHVAHRIERDEGGTVRAPAPALVVSVAVSAGDRVDEGAPLVVVETMKMETTVRAPYAAAVRDVMVRPNLQVDAGAPLVQLDPRQLEPPPIEPSAAVPRVTFASSGAPADGATARGRCLALLARMRWQVLGFDATAADIAGTIREYRGARAAPETDRAEVLAGELAVLTAFADITVLGRNRRDGEAAGEDARNPEQDLHHYLRSLDLEAEGLPAAFRARLTRALAHLGVGDLARRPRLERAVYRVFRAQQLAGARLAIVTTLLDGLSRPLDAMPEPVRDALRDALDRVIGATELRYPVVGDLARNRRFRLFDAPVIDAGRREVMVAMRGHLEALVGDPEGPARGRHIEALVGCPHLLFELRVSALPQEGYAGWAPLLEVLTRRNYIVWALDRIESTDVDGYPVLRARYRRPEERRRHDVVATLAGAGAPAPALRALARTAAGIPDPERIVADVYVRDATRTPEVPPADDEADALRSVVRDTTLPAALDRVAFSLAGTGVPTRYFTFRRSGEGWSEDRTVRGLHPLIAFRLHLWRLREHFDVERMPSPVDTHLFQAVARANPRDERLMAAAEVRDLTPVRDPAGRLTALPELERVLAVCLDGLRQAQASRVPHRRPPWNRLLLFIWPPVDVPLAELRDVVARVWPLTAGLGLEEIRLRARFPNGDGGLQEAVLRVSEQAGRGVVVRKDRLPTTSLQPLDGYTSKVVAARKRGTPYPYELVRAITGPDGRFVEYDLDGTAALVPVDRAPGGNTAGVVVGLVETPTARYPEGMRRVVLMGDPTKALGSVAEPECRRIIGALDLAASRDIPVEWFAISAGARIALDSGTENMDWVSRVLRRIIEFTQAGGTVNVVVTGINVGAQPYWNAEATMLMHTTGMLVMTPDSAMVLTGKQALDYSGGVSADDNFGIGGYDRVMGPNGQAQYWAPDLAGACALLFRYYEHTYRAPGERFPRRARTTDPADRDVRVFPHVVAGCDFRTVGDIFSATANPDRKKPFDIRTVMRATIDQDREPLERWAAMQDAENVVVFDAHLGGWPATMLGIESRPLPRYGSLPADGPDHWTAGTLFPGSSRKAARAINAASRNRPLVVLANLSGFDGSPESLRRRQLEFGAEIGRAIVNFAGPIVFCVVSRYHGGAFVVFSAALHDNLQVFAVEGTYASVLGGAPAAAVVFSAEVDQRTRTDPRVADLETAFAHAAGDERTALRSRLAEVTAAVRSEKLGQVAAEFDRIHTVQRAREVGSVHEIIPAATLRPTLIAAVDRGMARGNGRTL